MLPIVELNSRTKRWPGQVPKKPKVLQETESRAPDFNINRLFDFPVSSAQEVIRDLPLEPGVLEEWINYIEHALISSQNELDFRKEISIKTMGHPPVIRNIVAMRAIKYYRYMSKSIHVFHIDLSKAEARGGNYFRRVPKGNGKGYNYYYSEDDYNRSTAPHLNGENANNGYLTNKVKNILNSGVADGARPEVFKNLVKKYGVVKIEKVLKGCVENGDVKIKAKRFYWVKGSDNNEKADKR